MGSSDETLKEESTQPGQRTAKCRFYNTAKGCRAGNSCPFAHLPVAEGNPEKVPRKSRRVPRNAYDNAVDAPGRPDTAKKTGVQTSASTGSQAIPPENRQERPSRRSRPRTTDRPEAGPSEASKAATLQQSADASGGSLRFAGHEEKPAASRRNAKKIRDAPKRTLDPVNSAVQTHISEPSPISGLDRQEERSERRSTPQQRTPAPRRPPVSRPVPAAKSSPSDVQSSELSQLERRFRSSYRVQNTLSDGSVTVSFDLPPTDPDFVFDLEGDVVKCQLHIPSSYPSAPASLKVGNEEIPRGLARNVETGFDNQARAAAQLNIADSKRPTLLSQTTWLDRNLESLLSAPPSSTVTFVRHVKRPEPSISSNGPKEGEPSTAGTATVLRPEAEAFAPRASVTVSRFTAGTAAVYKMQAPLKTSPRRDRELGQIERRFSESFKLIRDSQEETVVIFSILPSELGVSHNIQTLQLQLHVPKGYPSEHPSVRVLKPDMPTDIRQNMEDAFKRYASLSVPKEKLTMQFMLNRLDRDLSLLVHGKPVSDRLIIRTPKEATEAKSITEDSSRDARGIPATDAFAAFDDDKSRAPLHPPFQLTNSDSLEEEDANAALPVRAEGESETESGEESEQEQSGRTADASEGGKSDKEQGDDYFLSAASVNVMGGTSPRNSSEVSPAPAQTNVVGGIEIRLPDIILERVATLECSSISLQLRCGRCKNNVEIKGLTPMQNTRGSSRVYCNTCGSEGLFGFHKEILHPSHLKLGRILVQGFLPTDLHPSSYISTCESCSIPSPSPHRSVAVGQPVSFNCRSCHCKMMFQIQTVRFTKVGGGDVIADAKSGPVEMRRKVKKVKEPGLVVGQPLPDLGTCKHYRKSHRWLRFPCCGKLYPCDVCHETAESHVAPTLATRMVCGYCSREQPFSQKPCVCGRSTTEKKSVSGFWEGGSGTRDRARMSRNDSRKYHGLHKTQSKKGVSIPKKANENEGVRAEDRV